MQRKYLVVWAAAIATVIPFGCQTITPPDEVWDRAEQFRRKDPTVRVKVGEAEFTSEGGETIIDLLPDNSTVCPGPHPEQPDIGPMPEPRPDVQPGPGTQPNQRERDAQPPAAATQPLWQSYYVGCYDCSNEWGNQVALNTIEEIEGTFEISIGELLMENVDDRLVVYAGMQDSEFPLDGESDTVVIIPWSTEHVDQDRFELTKRLEFVIPGAQTYVAFHFGEERGVLIIRGSFEASMLRLLSIGVTHLRVNDLMNNDAPNGNEDYLDVRRNQSNVSLLWHTPGMPDLNLSVDLRNVLDPNEQHFILE